MSESAEKATRRELRRAFGPEAADAIQEHDQQLRALTVNHNAAQQARLALEQKLNARLDEHAKLLLTHKEFRERTWRDRFRWILAGR